MVAWLQHCLAGQGVGGEGAVGGGEILGSDVLRNTNVARV